MTNLWQAHFDTFNVFIQKRVNAAVRSVLFKTNATIQNLKDQLESKERAVEDLNNQIIREREDSERELKSRDEQVSKLRDEQSRELKIREEQERKVREEYKRKVLEEQELKVREEQERKVREEYQRKVREEQELKIRKEHRRKVGEECKPREEQQVRNVPEAHKKHEIQEHKFRAVKSPIVRDQHKSKALEEHKHKLQLSMSEPLISQEIINMIEAGEIQFFPSGPPGNPIDWNAGSSLKATLEHFMSYLGDKGTAEYQENVKIPFLATGRPRLRYYNNKKK